MSRGALTSHNPRSAHPWRAALLAAVLATASIAGADPPQAAMQDAGPQLLVAQQQIFRGALAKAAPCIVRIDTVGGAAPLAQSLMPGPQQAVAAPLLRQGDGPTTGLIVSADGFILTSNFSFLHDPLVITAALPEGRRLVARLVARDRVAGLALLKIDAAELPTPQWLPRSAGRVGQWALAAGYGHGTRQPTLSVGVLSGLQRLQGRAVQTDAKLSPANYGGPLFDIEGRVIGLCVPKAGDEDEQIAGVEWYDSGIGFAIYADYIQERLPRLMRGETLERGLVGVRFDQQRPLADTDEPPGVRVTDTRPSRAAGEDALQVDDLVTHIDGEPVATIIELRRSLIRKTPGDRIRLRVLRDSQSLELEAVLFSAAELQAAAASQPAPSPATLPAETHPAGSEP